MYSYQLSLLLGEGLIFGLVALGVLIAFQWLRFPDLTPDGSFALGAAAYAQATLSGIPPSVALLAALAFGALAGICTAAVNTLARVPTVIAGLLVSSALYSVTWLFMGKPNQFIDPELTLVGNVSGATAAWFLLVWLAVIWLLIIVALTIAADSMWGLRIRAIGENPLLAQDLGVSEAFCRFSGLAVANGIVGLAGALFAQRSFSADISMGLGVTISGLSGMIVGLLIVGSRRKMPLVFLCVLLGGIFHKLVVFLTLALGFPAESFRLISAAVLLVLFVTISRGTSELLRGLRWN